MELQVPNCKTVHLFNCDNTFKLDSIEALLTTVKDKVEFEISIKKHCFKLSEMSSVSDGIVPTLIMDFSVFVVHANESRLYQRRQRWHWLREDLQSFTESDR